MSVDKDNYTQLANTIRVLSMDAVQRAKSGHPGAPMGMADIATVLWKNHLKHNPSDPQWADRDRFVLSNGHASILLYSLLHLSGYALSKKDLQNFRQLHSKTPGHPEYGETPGVETTTGPLGQGLANAVGMALAERLLGEHFNQEDCSIVDHYTYVFVGDGCLMEGISHEACSLAGTLGLNKLIVFYDDNGISIDGNVESWFSDNTAERFRAYQWNVIDAVDGHDAAAVDQAIQQARGESNRPTLIICKTEIGAGSPNKKGTEDCHGAPLGEEEVAKTRIALGWEHPPFEVPKEIQEQWNACAQGKERQTQWQARMDTYAKAYPELYKEFNRRISSQLPENWDQVSATYIHDVCTEMKNMATRQSSGKALEAYTQCLPELVGGSADLAGSNITLTKLSRPIGENKAGNYIYFGVREFAMTAIATGIVLHKGFIPFTATFLTFSDYARNAIRMAALMRQNVIMIYTHDSIALGEDGPTHQPIEHLCSLRLIPGLNVWRPCDACETAVAWKWAIEAQRHTQRGPSVLALTRQALPAMQRTPEQVAGIARGAYVLADNSVDDSSEIELILLATGSEVSLVMQVYENLIATGRRVRVVSMPCCEAFDAQALEYRLEVLPAKVKCRVAVEAGVGECWYRYVGDHGAVFSIDRYGASAPAGDLMQHYGFTAEQLEQFVEQVLAKQS
ncbi:MAG: transketolase [Candidatus Oxydemutatoraceae bacterium WSBS_2016_MAG_OTU14]